MKHLEINTKWCKGCGICVAFCPKNVLALNNKVFIADDEACIFCGTCERLCPDFAIYISEEVPEHE